MVKHALGVLLVLASAESFAQATVTDTISIHSTTDFNSRRSALVRHIWGVNAINTTDDVTSTAFNQPNSLDIPLPAGAAQTISRYTIRIPTRGNTPTGWNAARVEVVADHFFHSTTPTSGGKLVIMSPGHTCHYGSLLLESQMVAELLADGYDVLATYMPRQTPTDCVDFRYHGELFTGNYRPAIGLGLHPMGYFLDPVRRSLNHAMANYHYTEVYMVGLSGGGWTTTVYSALDPRIQVSIPVAGSWPFYFQQPPGPNSPSNPPASYQDEEQNDDAAAGTNGNDFYNFAGTKTGFLDLYVLGSYSHRQVQVLNRNDDCCFGQGYFNYSGPAPAPASWDQAVRAYEIQVANQIANLPHPGGSSGEFRVEINEAIDCVLPGPGYTCSGHVPFYHELSKNTRVNVVLSELDGATRTIDAGSGSLFARGTDSFFYQYLPTGWSSTGLQGIGTPAVVTSSVHQFDMFFRDPTNHLVHAYFNGSTWTTVADISALMLSDPIAVSNGGQVQLVFIGTDYGIYRAGFINGAWTNLDRVPVGPLFAVGQIAMSTGGSTSVDIVFRGHDAGTGNPYSGGLYHTHYNGSFYTAPDNAGGAIIKGFPTAVPTQAGLQTFAFGTDDRMYQGTWANGTWSWVDLATSVPGANVPVLGTPSAYAHIDGTLDVFARINTTPFGPVGSFHLTAGGIWQFANWGANTFGSPVATTTTATLAGLDTAQEGWSATGGNWSFLGGILER